MKEVTIFCWTYCPYCIKAKVLLDEKGIIYEEKVIDNDPAALKSLKSETGSGTVPQIFVEGSFVGGCDDLFLLDDEGKFDQVFK